MNFQTSRTPFLSFSLTSVIRMHDTPALPGMICDFGVYIPFSAF
jgi:hypothetical protein